MPLRPRALGLGAERARVHPHQADDAVGSLRRDDGKDEGESGRLQPALDQVGEDSRDEEQKEREGGKQDCGGAILRKENGHGKQHEEDDERSRVAEEAAAARGAPGGKGTDEGEQRRRSRVEEEAGEDAPEQAERSDCGAQLTQPAWAMPWARARRSAQIADVQQEQRNGGGGEENEQRRQTAMRHGPQHEGGGRDEQPDQRPLGSGGEGDGDAEQSDALPVPEE